ncbi:MAG: IspD/TarI family cytidylyltransferase [Carbonactinosporaceae bacterium]
MAASKPRAAGVVLAGGVGARLGAGLNKAYLRLGGRSLIGWALHTLAGVPGVHPLVLVARPADRDAARRALERDAAELAVEMVTGGATRHGSEYSALRHLVGPIEAGDVDAVLIHDAARPLASVRLAGDVLRVARTTGGAVPGLPAGDLIEVRGARTRVAGGTRAAVRVQTPQAFVASPLLAAFRAADASGFSGTDTASCVEAFSDVEVRWVPGEATNIKITYPHDLVLAERLHALLVPGASSPRASV